jgi:CRISPR-associated protein Cas1
MRPKTVPPDQPAGPPQGAPIAALTFTDDDVSDALAGIAETFQRREAPGVTIIEGFGARLRVERSELQAVDGIGPERRTRLWARSDRSLRRVIVTARSGSVSLDALRWVNCVGAALIVLDDSGVVFASTPRGLDDARLRRAQALAAGTDVGLGVARHLLDALLRGRADIARTRLSSLPVADTLDEMRTRLVDANDVDELRLMEMSAAALWWSAWHGVAPRWVAKDRGRIPDGWRTWPGRASALGGAADARHATHPVNALINLGTRIAEIEATITVAAVGLDPAFGVSHTDQPGRNSFVLDVLEGLRPTVEDFVLQLVADRPLLKRDFTEAATGELRVAPPFSHEFVEILTPRLTSAAGPLVEQVARMIAQGSPVSVRVRTPVTRAARRAAGKAAWAQRAARAPIAAAARTARRKAERRCEGCGVVLPHHQRRWCGSCWPSRRAEAGKTGAVRARAALDDGAVRALKGRAISAGRVAARDARVRTAGWEPEDWERRIRPALRARGVTAAQVQQATGVGRNTAYRALQGRQVPAPGLWTALAALARVGPGAHASSPGLPAAGRPGVRGGARRVGGG